MKERIERVLKKSGFLSVPQNKNEDLSHYGLSSLTLALLILELESEFNIKIPVLPIKKKHFLSVNTIEAYVKQLGGK